MCSARAMRLASWPEAGFAGREDQLALLLCAPKKAGAHGGTTGFPVLNARDVRFLDV